MGFSKLFRRKPSHSFASESSFSTYSTAQDVRTQTTLGGGSPISSQSGSRNDRFATSTGYASHGHGHGHGRSYSAAHQHPQNPPPAFASELSAQHSAARSQSPDTRSTLTLSHTPTPAPAGGPTGSPNYRCRDCETPFTLHHVRNDRNGRRDRPYYRCNRCGDWRAWADMQGVYAQNPRCRCGECSRFDQSKGGVWYFACAFRQCGFYAERDWRVEDGEGQAQAQGRGQGRDVGYRGGRVEMA